jgi:amidase
VHAGTAAGRAGLTYVNRPAKKAHRAARTERERPFSIGWSLIGQQGFPAITVPAGFTTQVWDRASDGNGGTCLVGPVSASLPVGIDFLARPFDEALLFRIASAFEAANRHRRPPAEFGPLPGEP